MARIWRRASDLFPGAITPSLNACFLISQYRGAPHLMGAQKQYANVQSIVISDRMTPHLTNQSAYGILMLAFAGFAATTLLLSFSLMSTETFDLSVSPRTLIEKQLSVHTSASDITETIHNELPWRADVRRNRRGDAKQESMMLQPHRQEQVQEPTTTRTIDNPCKNDVKLLPSDNIPSHCTGYSLPFTTTDVPNECWARIFLLPSYPTSGNELVHVMFQRLTGLVSFNSFPIGQAAFDLSTPTHTGLTMSYDEEELCQPNNTLRIPVAGQVLLSKNHYRNQTGGPNPQLFHSTQEQRHGSLPGNIAGIVRLARNPGDHLLRNFFRWDHRNCHDDSCFYKNAKSTCRILGSKAFDWNQFHSYWNDYDSTVPQMILHYEEVASRATASRVFRELIEFVAAEESEPGTMKKKVLEFVREPTYEQGGLVAKVCGVKVARRVHKLTAEYSSRMGYEFDNERGVWLLNMMKDTPKMVS